MTANGWAKYGWLLGSALAVASCGGKDHADGEPASAGHPGAGAGHGGSPSTGSGGTAGRGSSMAGASTGGTPSAGSSGDGAGGADGGASGSFASGGDAARGGSGAQGGSGNGGSSAGSSGTLPAEPPGFTPVSQASPRDKLDLLLMIDNSISMFQKQSLLADSVPFLMRRLTQPNCVDASGSALGPPSADGTCAEGVPEFSPVRDLHVGIITSSLGDHGSDDVCGAQVAAGVPDSHYDDRAQLLPTMRSGLTDWNGSGFLLWDPRDQATVDDPHTPLGATETDLPTFTRAFTDQLNAVGEHGCGYEASLEAWYRFLVDPTPPSTVTSDQQSFSQRGPINQVVLNERAAFLRPDSVLAILMMTDENDCSIIDEDGTQGWLVSYTGGASAGSWHMPRASAACDADPSDKCCRPCTATPIAGCADDPSGSGCSRGTTLGLQEDALNLRCFEQKRRFGIDLLYPTSRYVEALTSATIHPRPGGPSVPNPLFQGTLARDPSSVVLMGLVGVPWQDVSSEASWSDERALTYLSAADLAAKQRWSVMLGDTASHGVPTDTLMVESVDPRLAPLPQTHPLLPDVTIGSPSATTNTNPINGHEQQVNASLPDDLQLTCIFPLPTPIPCTGDNADGCDCNADDDAQNSPLCEGATSTTDGTQVAGKAYPALRELDVLRGIGNQAVVTSICAKNTSAQGSPATDPTYAYNPAMDALVEQLRPAFTPSCLTATLDVSPSKPGGTACHVTEVEGTPTGTCDCASLGRTDPTATVAAAAHQHLLARGVCADDGSTTSCDLFCVCEIPGVEGAALTRCQAGDDPDPADSGFCYIDPGQNAGSADLVTDCAPGFGRTLRFVGGGTPESGASVFTSCD